jgi:hypothetical protein
MRRLVVLCVLALGLAGTCAALAPAAAADQAETPAPDFLSHELRLAALLSNGGLPRDRAMHAWLARWHAAMDSTAPMSPAELRDAAAEAPRDRLVQWLWATADDVAAGCSAQAPCPDRALALATLEPDNGAAWLPALAEAARLRDADRTDRLIARMGDATRFEELFVDSAEAWYAAEALVPMTPAEVARMRAAGSGYTTGEQLAIVAAIARAAAMPMPALQPLLDGCRADRDPRATARRAACERIGRTMFDSGTTISRSIGFRLLEATGAASAADAVAMRRGRWLVQENNRVAPSLETDADALRRYFADLVATRDEYKAMERRIVRGGGRIDPPRDWNRGE